MKLILELTTETNELVESFQDAWKLRYKKHISKSDTVIKVLELGRQKTESKINLMLQEHEAYNQKIDW